MTVIVFFSIKGIVSIMSPGIGATITSDYLVKTAIPTVLKELRTKAGPRREIWHWDNAPVHKAKVVVEKLRQEHIKIMEHPPYSPDLSPPDFYLFGRARSAFSSRTFSDLEELFREFSNFLYSIPLSEFRSVFSAWPGRWTIVVETNGTYII